MRVKLCSLSSFQMRWSSATDSLQNSTGNQIYSGVPPHSETNKVTGGDLAAVFQHGLFLLTDFSSSCSFCPLLKENILEWRPVPSILSLRREGMATPGCLAATCFSSVGTLILTMASLEQLRSSAPAQPTALSKEAEALEGGVLTSLPGKGPAGYSGVLNFMYRLYYIFRALTLRKASLKCFPLYLTFISKTTEVKGSISSGPDLKAHENCIHEAKKQLNN